MTQVATTEGQSESSKKPNPMSFVKDVCVVGGCGRVGLPLAMGFARVGLKVAIYDINQKAVDTVNSRVMPFFERGAEELMATLSLEQMTATTDLDIISQAEHVVVIIGTPVDEHLNPGFSSFTKFIDSIGPKLVDGQMVILRSTVYPGTTARTQELIARYNPNVDLSFCPERVAEGLALEEISSLPQLVSGTSDQAVKRASALFSKLNTKILELSPLEAELAKLFTNSWRYIQFATANQFYMLAQEHGLDFYKIYNAMRWEYPRTQGFPKAGFAAGPCLFKDTMQLASFSDNRFFLGHSAMLINEGLPQFIVNDLKEKVELGDKTVGVLGMAFKGNIDDARSSLSYKLKKVLEFQSREVLCTDPYVRDEALKPLEEVVERSDILILGAPHRVYKELKFPEDKIVVDIWNFFEN